MKLFKGKAIYQPDGRAAEYARWACNFYTGCSNGCTYCYNKRWGWGNTPKLKAYFKSERHALEIFEKELAANLPELQKYGLFFSFSTDPCLKETLTLTAKAMVLCVHNNISIKLLTKKVNFLGNHFIVNEQYRKMMSVGFTLTGHDELEPGASPNSERIAAMEKLHDAGFKTWASIEPIIDFESSVDMIGQTRNFCDLYKIGLQSHKVYDRATTERFVRFVCSTKSKSGKSSALYFKDSLLQQADINREDLPENCVSRDYNMFSR